MERVCLQPEQRRSHRDSEAVSDEGDGDEENEAGDSGDSQVLRGSDDSDADVIDVVTEDENDDSWKETGTNDGDVWMNEKRHSGDGEVNNGTLPSLSPNHISACLTWQQILQSGTAWSQVFPHIRLSPATIMLRCHLKMQCDWNSLLYLLIVSMEILNVLIMLMRR